MFVLFILYAWFQRIYNVDSLPKLYYRLAGRRNVTVKQLRQLEKFYLKVNKLHLDLKYFERCHELDLCPKFLRFKAPKLDAYRDFNKVLKQVVLNQISVIRKDVRCATKSYKTAQTALTNNITFIEKCILMSLLRKYSRKTMEIVQRRHEKKLYNLWSSTSRLKNSQSLINLSNRKLSIEEENILQYGLNHHILPPKIDHDELKVSVEKGVCSLYRNKEVKSDTRDNIKYAVQSFVKNGNHICSTAQNKMYHKTLKDLSKDTKIKLCSFDKGNGLVILNSSDYYDKLDQIVNDRSKFTEIEPDPEKPHPVIQKQNSVNYYIDRYLKGHIDDEIRSDISPSGAQPGKLYGMCKVHKTGYPLRPVISMINTPEYKLAKFLDEYIKPNIPISLSCNSTDLFLENLKSFSLNPNMKVVSFDVVSLYTNIPLLETIQIIADSIYDASSVKKPPFPKASFIKLLTIATQGIFMYKDKIYKQTDGVAMGSPLGPSLANFFLGFLEKRDIDRSLYAPSFYNRYIDDICAIFTNNDHIQLFLDFINSLHPNLKFTIEYANDTFPFLNVEMKFNDFSFDSWVYRKPTHTGQMLNFSAMCPDKWKRGLILCMLNIGKRICSTEILFNEEVNKLRKMFQLNGYPVYYFNKVLNQFLNPVLNNSNSDNSDDDSNFVLIRIPYIGDHSYTLSKKLKKFVEDSNNCKVRIVFSSFKIRNYFSLKTITPKYLLSNVVYKFTCQNDSGISYIGETKRHFMTRVKEHLDINKTTKSEVKTHIKSCLYCREHAKCDSFQVIKKCQNNFNALVHEALLIRRHNPKLNKQLFQKGSLFTLKIFA